MSEPCQKRVCRDQAVNNTDKFDLVRKVQEIAKRQHKRDLKNAKVVASLKGVVTTGSAELLHTHLAAVVDWLKHPHDDDTDDADDANDTNSDIEMPEDVLLRNWQLRRMKQCTRGEEDSDVRQHLQSFLYSFENGDYGDDTDTDPAPFRLRLEAVVAWLEHGQHPFLLFGNSIILPQILA